MQSLLEDGKLPKPLLELVDQTLLEEGYYKVVDEIVYKVRVTFPECEPYYIHINRKNLSSLFSGLQMKRLYEYAPNIRKAQAQHVENRSSRDVPHQLYRLESTRSAAIQDSPRLSAPDILKPRESTREKEQKTETFLAGMSKLLFVPAFGGPNRIKRIREERVRIVSSILDVVSSDEKLLNSRQVKELLRISNITFDARLGKSYMEGWVRVKASPRTMVNEKWNWNTKCNMFCCVCAVAPRRDCCSFLGPQIHRHHKMWAVVKKSFIAFYEQPPCEISPLCANFAFTFSQHLEIYKGYGSTGSQKTVLLVGDSKTLKIKLSTRYEKKIWSTAILETRQLEPDNRTTDWCVAHRNQSFAPCRGGMNADYLGRKREVCKARWLVDAKETYEAVYHAIKNANYQVFIQGWWITPDLPLLRPANFDDPTVTLGGLVSQKAEQGVKVFILMYNEVSLATSLDTNYQFEAMQNLQGRENIFVIKHPEHGLRSNAVWFWSHHEKLVVVDQHHAFCGGVDLCWGRYDTGEHLLYNHYAGDKTEWPGIDFSNIRNKDFSTVSQYKNSIHAASCPRMPWHDIHCEHWGAVARDIARHFVQQWNHARFSMSSSNVPELIPMDHLPDQYYEESQEEEDDTFQLGAVPSRKGKSGKFLPVVWEKESKDDSYSLSVISEHGSQEPPEGLESEHAAAEDGANGDNASAGSGETLLEDEDSDTSEEEDELKKNARKNSSASRISEHRLSAETYLDRSSSQSSSKSESVGMRLRTLSSPTRRRSATNTELTDRFEWSAAMIGKNRPMWDVAANLTSCDMGYPILGQVLRSRGLWSGSPPGEKETSIHRCMVTLIEKSKRFIYIENQFFISGLESDEVVVNRVLDALCHRIMRAHESGSPFKVIVMIPLLPGFEGWIMDSPSIRRVLYYQYRSICRGPHSMFHYLLSHGVDPDDYIAFFSVRTWEKHENLIATELIYVHSKLMIVDDTTCLIGSGNINDRSLSGNRDSEVAVVMSNDPEQSIAGDFCKSLRLRLFAEHWGFSADLREAFDFPWHLDNFKKLKQTARRNTKIYETLFPYILPSDNIKSVAELRRVPKFEYMTTEYSEEAHSLLKSLKGHVVIFPLRFLSQMGDELKPGIRDDTTGMFLGEELYL